MARDARELMHYYPGAVNLTMGVMMFSGIRLVPISSMLGFVIGCASASGSSTTVTEGNPQSWDMVEAVRDDGDIRWNPDPNNPVVDYDLRYRNVSGETIRCEFIVQVQRVDRDDGKRLRGVTSERKHEAVLRREQEVTLSGRLKWYGDARVMPRIETYPRCRISD